MTQTQVDEAFLADVLSGLSSDPKSLPCKYFYDEVGSKLFDEICQLDEYYLTRTEHSIIEQNAEEIAEQIGERAMLVELGSGSSVKTRILLDHLRAPAAYVPVDISEEHLNNTVEELQAIYPHIEILPLAADFTKGLELPNSTIERSHVAVFFPGSTIGNFSLAVAEKLLTRIGSIVGRSGGLVIGIDLQKDPAVIEAAYNDSRGVTAQFNLNLLERINRELNGDFDVDQFEHKSVYNEEQGRIETSIVSLKEQRARVGGHVFEFAANEHVHTEYSHKYTVDGFANMARAAGFELHRHWKDPQGHFAILHLVID